MSHHLHSRLNINSLTMSAILLAFITVLSISVVTAFPVTANTKATADVVTAVGGTTGTDLKLSDAPAALQVAYQQARHRIETISETGKAPFWQAINAHNRLKIRFDGEAIVASSLQPQEGWHLRMQLSALGEPHQLESVAEATVRIEGNRLSYDRGVIEEWYINDPSGLEQGFTVAEPLSDTELVLELILSGDVSARLIEQGQALALSTPSGKQLRYEGLKAWDAENKVLATRLQLAGDKLQLQVNVEHAQYPITIDPWLVEEQKLTAADAAAVDEFGNSVAVSGNTAVVGANRDVNAGGESGSAYVFTRTGGSWNQQAKLIAADAAAADRFGISVAVSDDTAVVGAGFDNDAGLNSGSAYVFIRTGASWTQHAKLVAADAAAGDVFGITVAVSGDILVVGAPGDSDAGVNSGSAYVFTRVGGGWSQQAKLTATDAAAGDQFGASVAVSGDTAVLGAPVDDDAGSSSGSAYVFIPTGATTWGQLAKLTAADAALGDEFGLSVAISGDTAVVGAHRDDDGGGESGSAYVFTRTGGSWSQQAKLVAADAAAGDEFGTSVAVSGDTAVVGAYRDDNAGSLSGSVYMFNRTGITWVEQTRLNATDTAAGDQFGISVAVSGDTAMVGAHRDDDAGVDSGSAYAFDLGCNAGSYSLPHNQWRQISLPCNPGPGVNSYVSTVFGDDGLGSYGPEWALYVYIPAIGAYQIVSPSAVLQPGVAYWIIQLSGSTQILDLPDNSTPTLVTNPNACLSTGCVEVPLATQSGDLQWNMAGFPFTGAEPLSNARVVTSAGLCINGCDLSVATEQNLVHNQAWTYDGTAVYTITNIGDNLQPWTGYWIPALDGADGLDPVMLLPRP